MEQQEVGQEFNFFLIFRHVYFRGINVLDNKSELEKALQKQRKTLKQKLKEAENKTDNELEKMLAERAERLLKVSLDRQRQS